jgi:hypothetical protein
LPRPDWSESRLDKLGQRVTEQTDVVQQGSIRVQLRMLPNAAIAKSLIDAAQMISNYELSYRMFLNDEEHREQEKPPHPPADEIWARAAELMGHVREFAGIVQAPPVQSQT